MTILERIGKYFLTVGQAEENKQSDGDSDMSISEWIDEFRLAIKQAGQSNYTARQYGWQLERLAEYLAEREIVYPHQVNRRTLRRWGAGIADQWAPATQRQAICAARAFFRFLTEEEVIHKNPAKTLTLPNVPERVQRTLSAEEILKLLETAQDLSSPFQEREQALVSFLTDSGLRSRETCRLKVKDLKIEIDGSLYLIGKGNKEGKAYFGVKTAERIKSWLKVREAWLNEKGYPDPGTVFIAIGGTKPGHSLTTHGLRNILRRLGDAAGVDGVSPHAFRRTFATITIKNGASTRLAQLLGRWKKMNMVVRYTKQLENDEDDLQKLYRLYSPIDHIQTRQLTLPLFDEYE